MSAMTSSSFSSIAAALWQTVGAELVIFVVTLCFAVLLRHTSWKPQPKVAQKGKTSPEPSEKQPRAEKGHQNSAGPSTNSRIGRERAASGSAQNPTGTAAGKFDASTLIDEVCDIMNDNPSLRSCNRVLALYAMWQSNSKTVSLPTVIKSCKHSAVDFYSTMAHCAIRLGKLDLVEGVIDDMAQHGISRPLVFYESLMKQLAGQKHYQLALAMYDRLVADDLEPSAVTCSCLINFATEVGELERAIQFFNKLSAISTPSIRAYMTVLRVHARRQDWASSLATMRDMQRRGVPVDSLVVNIILATGVASDHMEAVEALVQEVDGWTPAILDVVSYNTLIKGHTQRNVADKAIQVISRMREKGLTPNAITFNTTMDAAVRSAKSKEAWNLLKEMYSLGLKPDKFTASVLIKGLSKSPCVEHVGSSLELLLQVDAMLDMSLKGTLYHTVLETAAKQGGASLLMQVFTQMKQHRIVPNAAAYRILVQALGQEGDVNRCRQIWEQMLNEDMRPQPAVFTALLESHLRQGEVEGALLAFESLRASWKKGTRGISQSLVEECRVMFIRSLCRISREPEATHIYTSAKTDGAASTIDNTTVTMLAKMQAEAGSLSQAWTTIEDMGKMGQRPNESTIHSFLSACLKHSQGQYATTVFKMALAQGMTFSQGTYALLIKLQGLCGQIQEALSVYELMINRQSIEPTPETQVSILRVCFQCRWPEKAFELLEQAKKHGKVDGKVYKAAICGAASAGLIPKGIELLEEALSHGASLPVDAIESLLLAANKRCPASAGKIQRIAKAHGHSI
eukprot:gnl/TRDRNA2_/TRDRNA2_176171_c0_seq3.p1 gnl/TRDRNA2_/TRDRNA2_176171_c0~~gnl/TRDRNA2_/TRDRNA2_176171_c0_seq3.p1  ORF type:complete len:797 (-),score=181.03 gnl/TRDRNA2_/TRDRNA2_176171_c0_seq3:54-2444(-)